MSAGEGGNRTRKTFEGSTKYKFVGPSQLPKLSQLEILTQDAGLVALIRFAGSVLIWPRQSLSRKPLPAPGNLFPSERLRLGLPVPSEQAEINAVLSLDAQVDKPHWQWFAVEVKGGVCGYIARETGRVSWCKDKRWLPDWPFDQSRDSVVIIRKSCIPTTLKLLLCHIAKELNVLKIKKLSRISYGYGKVTP